MIIRLTEETSKVGFRIRDWKNSQFLTDWPHLQLCIRAGQLDQPRGPNGSPWYLYGYWPGKPTCVDLANPPMPDFPAMVLPAFEKGDNCEVIFHLPKRFHELPYGRYTGILMYCPEGSFKLVNWKQPPKTKEAPDDPFDWIPPQFRPGAMGCCPKPLPQCPPPPPKQHNECCVLGLFDIDYGLRCDEHIVDLVTVQYALNTCEEDC